MIDGNVNEFVDNLYYGSEMYFIFRGKNTLYRDGSRIPFIISCLTTTMKPRYMILTPPNAIGIFGSIHPMTLTSVSKHSSTLRSGKARSSMISRTK